MDQGRERRDSFRDAGTGAKDDVTGNGVNLLVPDGRQRRDPSPERHERVAAPAPDCVSMSDCTIVSGAAATTASSEKLG
jgi:hypothetical protein